MKTLGTVKYLFTMWILEQEGGISLPYQTSAVYYILGDLDVHTFYSCP